MAVAHTKALPGTFASTDLECLVTITVMESSGATRASNSLKCQKFTRHELILEKVILDGLRV